MMERFLERLTYSKYKDNFIIKGGLLVVSMVGVSMRSTMDIDTTIKNINLSKEDVLKVINEIIKIDLDDGITFEVNKVENIMENFEYPGLRIDINAIIDKMITPIKIDISTGDVITSKAINYEYRLLIEDRNINLWTYNLETILAEKLQAILARGIFNTRMRDFYDIHTLMSLYSDKIDKKIFSEAFKRTSEKRNTVFNDIDSIIQIIAKNEEILTLWQQYQMKYSYALEIDFESAIESVMSLVKIIETNIS